jgi:hypothetical protein
VDSRSPAAVVVCVGIVVVLLAAAVQVQAARERAYPPAEGSEEALYLRSGIALRRLTGAYNGLFADVYWIRAIQYYGGTKQRLEAASRGPASAAPLSAPSAAAAAAPSYPLLYPLLDITTTLDPRFNIAYRFGAIFLAEPHPRGADRPDLAIALLQKGVRERPDKWEYKEDIAFVHYWFLHDFHAAADWFKQASEVPGAPWWLRSMAAATLAQGGDRRASKMMWTEILQTAELDWMRKDAERRLLQLQALDLVDALQRIVDEYARSGGMATDWRSLVTARRLRGIPVDPTGTPFELVNGRVQLSRSSSLWPPPEEPAAAERPPS